MAKSIVADDIQIKPKVNVMAFCDDMFERKSACGKNYPSHWKVKTRERLEAAGLIESKGQSPGDGAVYYFTEVGLAWYLSIRPERNRK